MIGIKDVCNQPAYLTTRWIELTKIKYPHEAMLEEARSLDHLFKLHRNERGGEEGHKEWSGLAIYGISSEKIGHYSEYGYRSHDEVPYRWCLEEEAPITTRYFKESFPHVKYHRIRFLRVKAGGWVNMHQDFETMIGPFPINMALNMPEGCIMRLDDQVVPFEAGKAFAVNVSYRHDVRNVFSKEDRYIISVIGELETLDHYA